MAYFGFALVAAGICMTLCTKFYIYRLFYGRETTTRSLLKKHMAQLDQTADVLMQEKAWRYNNYVDALERLEKVLKVLAGKESSPLQTRVGQGSSGVSTNRAL